MSTAVRHDFGSVFVARRDIFAAVSHTLTLSPGGHLFVEPDDLAEPKLNPVVAAQLTDAFADTGARGLELLASALLHEPLPPTFGFWRGLARRFFTALCHNPNLENAADLIIAEPGDDDWLALAETAPPMKGLEYLNGAVLARLWDELEARVRSQIARTAGGAAAYLKNCNPTWHAVDRVTFHLAENKRNPAHPFAFLATYTHRVSEQGRCSICRWAGRWRNMLAPKIAPRCRPCFHPH